MAFVQAKLTVNARTTSATITRVPSRHNLARSSFIASFEHKSRNVLEIAAQQVTPPVGTEDQANDSKAVVLEVRGHWVAEPAIGRLLFQQPTAFSLMRLMAIQVFLLDQTLRCLVGFGLGVVVGAWIGLRLRGSLGSLVVEEGDENSSGGTDTGPENDFLNLVPNCFWSQQALWLVWEGHLAALQLCDRGQQWLCQQFNLVFVDQLGFVIWNWRHETSVHPKEHSHIVFLKNRSAHPNQHSLEWSLFLTACSTPNAHSIQPCNGVDDMESEGAETSLG